MMVTYVKTFSYPLAGCSYSALFKFFFYYGEILLWVLSVSERRRSQMRLSDTSESLPGNLPLTVDGKMPGPGGHFQVVWRLHVGKEPPPLPTVFKTLSVSQPCPAIVGPGIPTRHQLAASSSLLGFLFSTGGEGKKPKDGSHRNTQYLNWVRKHPPRIKTTFLKAAVLLLGEGWEQRHPSIYPLLHQVTKACS